MRFEFSIYCYNPDVDDAPRMQDYILKAEEGHDMILLDTLIQLKEKDPNLSLRRSRHEGMCGPDDLNINGKNGLVCIISISTPNQPSEKIVIRSLPGLPVIHDLVVDMGQFYAQHEKTKPYLLNNRQNPPTREHLQIPKQRERPDGLYECTLCACYSTSCLPSWWNLDKFISPVGLLAVYRFLVGSRDTETDSRLDDLSDAFSVFHYHSIMNCVNVCLKGLNPTCAIGHIRSMLSQRDAQTQA